VIWSYSDSRLFRKCQRAWYLKQRANSNATDDRRELFVLSQLQSISAWRGAVVDDVVEHFLSRAWAGGHRGAIDGAISWARDRFKAQLVFARAHRVREAGFVKSREPGEFAALHCIEYGGRVTDEEAASAWADVEQSIRNLLAMSELVDSFVAASRIVAQRPLVFSLAEVRVRAVPDIITFYADRPPCIVDWKVHTFGLRDSRLQLMIYALALARCKPHADFPAQPALSATSIGVEEVQLLVGRRRAYTLTEEDIQDAESYIAASAEEMGLALGDRSSGALAPWEFPPTRYPDVCTACAFRSYCWEDHHDGSPVEHLSDHQPGLPVIAVPATQDPRPALRPRRVPPKPAVPTPQAQLSLAEPGHHD